MVFVGWLLWLWLGAGSANAGRDGPEISRSRGRPSGLVVLWPRIVPDVEEPTIHAMAARLQARLYAAAASAVDYRRVDARPAPERVCPAVGCRAPAVSLVLGHRDGGCVLVLSVGPAGRAPRALTGLVGDVRIEASVIPFRAPPEQHFVVEEFVACANVEAAFDDESVAARLRALSTR